MNMNVNDAPVRTAIVSYPSNRLNRASYTYLPMSYEEAAWVMNSSPSKRMCMCYTISKGTMLYKPHSAGGMVGTIASSTLARRRRI